MKELAASLLAMALSVASMMAPASAQENVSGNWEITLSGPQGSTTLNLMLKQQGESLTGEIVTPLGALAVAGSASGGTLTLSNPFGAQVMGLELKLTGTILGDVLNGSIKLGDLGDVPFQGKRAANAPKPPEPVQEPEPAAGAKPGDVNGTWDISLAIEGLGRFPVTGVLKQEGETVTGTLSSLAGEVAVRGTMLGKSLRLEFMLETPQGSMPIKLTGELGVGGIVGKAGLDGTSGADWTAIRRK